MGGLLVGQLGNGQPRTIGVGLEHLCGPGPLLSQIGARICQANGLETQRGKQGEESQPQGEPAVREQLGSQGGDHYTRSLTQPKRNMRCDLSRSVISR